ncbi:MAG: hypothetical protein P8185_15275 [Deltaproteobacteria bacterium]|jgi:hypothetical protein
MKRCALIGLCLIVILICVSCWGPKKSVQEEKVLVTLSHIQGNLETDISYQQYLELLSRAKIEIDILKNSGKNNSCFMSAVDKCYAYYLTGGKAWKQKMEATEEARKNDMDLTMSVLQSQAALSIQMANNCFKN